MTSIDDLSALDLAALVASRVCHDIISPVGAITNGLEVLDEENAEDMKEFAMDLIRKSARQASAKLQFARLAFGAAGSAGAEIDLGDAQSVAAGFLANEKADIDWQVPRLLMPKNRVKLLLNLILLANQCVPRGGLITVTMSGEAANPRFELKVTGSTTKVPAVVLDLTAGHDPERIDAHTVQPVYTVLLARDSGMDLEVVKQEDGVSITASTKE